MTMIGGASVSLDDNLRYDCCHRQSRTKEAWLRIKKHVRYAVEVSAGSTHPFNPQLC